MRQVQSGTATPFRLEDGRWFAFATWGQLYVGTSGDGALLLCLRLEKLLGMETFSFVPIVTIGSRLGEHQESEAPPIHPGWDHLILCP